MKDTAEDREWAWDEFGASDLGDARRLTRLIDMAAAAVGRPSGLVAEVFADGKAREGAYDFLESGRTPTSSIVAGAGRACARRAAKYPFVYVPVDGTSLTITDWELNKDLGAVGTHSQHGRGLQVITSIAVSPTGVPLGVGHLEWWKRQRDPRKAYNRPPRHRETQKFCDVIQVLAARFKDEAPATRLWFQLDRGCDARAILQELARTNDWFTVRAHVDRRIKDDGVRRRYLREVLRRQKPLGDYFIEVPARFHRKPRRARLRVRAKSVTLRLRNAWAKKIKYLNVNVLLVREAGTTPRGEAPIEWLLLTNYPMRTLRDAHAVVRGYAQRWKIEEFHRAWKTGVCRSEATQLRSAATVSKWATILASVAMRVERLKRLSRSHPEQLASVELTSTEISALLMLRKKRSHARVPLPDALTIGEATLWIAELGGYTGRSSGGPPGATTIKRGLEYLRPAAEMLGILERKHG